MSHPPNNLDDDEVFENALEECLVAIAVRVGNYISSRSLRQPVRTSALSGATYVHELMHSRVRCYENLWMKPNLFRRLCDELKGFGLEDQRISVEEGVMMFLYTIGHNERVRVVAERYQHSTEIVHHWFKSVLAAIIRLGTQIIKPRYPRTMQPEIQDEFYVVDAGYPNISGFLAPYRGERYHRSDYRSRAPSTKRELFNQRHSSMPNYKLARQSNIVLACCAVHNFIIRHQQYDDLFEEWANNEVNNDEDEEQGSSSAQDGVGESSDQNVMHAIREEIANQIWANRR
ncbi:hypothetical protein Cni_G13743 [Canna indica]|uniref:DUF8040 domain-containing protein n=1 Tax=Canna indica TaxID=4628 RepID=A0AAQ3KAP9_9LILI|nr:hypothetical protein Cni_G13743 [Canna indica]